MDDGSLSRSCGYDFCSNPTGTEVLKLWMILSRVVVPRYYDEGARYVETFQVFIDTFQTYVLDVIVFVSIKL